jgi:fructokinase
VAGRLRRRYAVPTGFDTDVNGAALAEGRWGAARGLEDFAYITVGTGIGVGLIAGGRTIGGFSHAEAGHLRIGRAPGDDWPGACSFHGDCVEGLASGPAIARASVVIPVQLRPTMRSGRRRPRFGPASPQSGPDRGAAAAVLIGGGVMEAQPNLFPMIRAALGHSLNGYVTLPEGDFVLPPGLGAMAGPCGGIALALDALGADPSARKDDRARRSA